MLAPNSELLFGKVTEKLEFWSLCCGLPLLGSNLGIVPETVGLGIET